MQLVSLSEMKLLYIEDNKQVRIEMKELLEDKCSKLYIAKNGKEGIELFEKFAPDIVLTDIAMPKMNGIEMSQKIKQLNISTPIIITTAFSDAKYILKAIDVGINNYLLKPVSLKKLFETLEKVSSEMVLQKKLKRSEQILDQYKDVVDTNSIVSKATKNGIITYVNRQFCDISGYTEEALLGQKHNIVRHEDVPDLFFKQMWETILSKKRWRGVIKNRAKDGSIYYVDSTITPILDENNDIIEFISIRQDITKRELQRQRLENKLQLSAKTLDEKISFIEEFEKALTKGNTLFCRINIYGIITMSSDAINNLFGFNLTGTEYRNLITKKSIQKMFFSNIQNDEPWQAMIGHTDKNSNELFLQSSFTPIMGVKKDILEIFCFYVDLTESVNLNKEIIATQREVISTMGAIGETRSRETGEHVKRVAEYSKLLAIKYGLTIEEAEELKMASPMHDIGKVGIPDSILNKPGKLTEDEFVIMKTHAELGHEMLRHSNQQLLLSASIVANEHHEKWDGSGYPRGLSGENIHIYGRITAIADVFDALGHNRIYKKAWPLEDILELLNSEKEKHFDPNLVDIFMENLDQFLEIKNSFDE